MSAHYDLDGRLHLTDVAISKAPSIEAYSGAMLCGADRIENGEVDPNRNYKVFRPGSELMKAARSFAGVPIVRRHIELTAPLPDDILGATGSHPVVKNGHLCCDAVLWSRDGIDGLIDGSRAAPSIGFVFDLDMRPGTFRGEPFDCSFKNIHGHHLALTPRGRSGLSIAPPVPHALAA